MFCSKSHTGESSTSTSSKLPRNNWQKHAEAHDQFCRQGGFLKSNFLYSFPSERPEEKVAKESLFEVQNTHRMQSGQVEKAWRVLSSPSIVSIKNYIRPGKSLAAQIQIVARKPDNSGKLAHEAKKGKANLCSGHSLRYPGNPSGNNSCPPAKMTFMRSQNSSTIQEKISGPTFVDDITDDDVLENIDVDQIVMEHYQSSCTPQPSVSKCPSVTPIVSMFHCSSSEAVSLPPELCCICSHGCELGFCFEKANHLREMKDMLISISNELLDHAADLTSAQVNKLRENRMQLNKQIQELEKDKYPISSMEKQPKPQFYTEPRGTTFFKVGHPSTNGFEGDSSGFWPTGHVQSEPSHCGLMKTTTSNFHTNIFGGPDFISREAYIPQHVPVKYVEGSGDKKWSEINFPWTRRLEANNKKVFGNHSFRPNQREIINATMSGNDVFVLMPTGGGKSLTYQLPALICPGITLVISPLVSLIQDQIMHLSQVNIPAAYLSASMEWTEQQDILRELSSDNCRFKLLYVTPEKIAKSDVLVRNLENLYARDLLSRIVIDEAHCVSQWGHDFRPDYQALGILKQRFPKSPALALTATATASVKEDVVQALGLVNCIIFRQSFNRPNLQYSVTPKTKKCIDDIDKFIKADHFDECGIIYCLSRMDCEKVAERLQECGHKSSFYHSTMDPAQRTFVQKQWSKDEINIMCATVAFGMGINKPDVRFVIHHSLPKSIEGYHQECGRAGRDGQRSSCVLYYNYGDYIRLKHMITQGTIEQSPAVNGYNRNNTAFTGRIRETNTENLLRMVSYCENAVDCRRFLQLLHFGEKFDSENCGRTCDNCCRARHSAEKDVTNTAKQLVELVKMTGQQFSSTHILEVYRGSLSQSVKKHRHNSLSLHGAGKNLNKDEASRILRHLVVEDYLVEDVKKSDIYGSITSVLKVNESVAQKLWFGGEKILLRLPCSEKALKFSKSDATPAKDVSSSGRLSPPRAGTPAQPQPEVDLDLSAKLYSALRILRTTLLKEAGEGVMAYHIFGNATLQQISKRIPRTKEELLDINGLGKAKVSKYGDRVLEVIESTIADYYQREKNSASSNDSNESMKRRRNSYATAPIAMIELDDDFAELDERSRKMASRQTGGAQTCEQSCEQYEDADMDFDELICDAEGVTKRVLPCWSIPKNKHQPRDVRTIEEYSFKR